MADIQQLAETTLGRLERSSVKAEIKRAPEVLLPGESPEMIAIGQYEGVGNSLLIATDRRLIIINEVGSFNKKLKQHDVTWDRISHVSSEDGVLGEIELKTSAGEIEIERVLPKKRAGEMANYIRAKMSTPASVTSAPTQPDVMDQLKKLGELHAAGVLTQEEFDAKKAELLARM